MAKKYPLRWISKNANLDNRQITESRVVLIQRKQFLKRIYDEWYQLIIRHLPEMKGPVVELGSGAGFLSEQLSGLITSDVFYCSNIRTVMDGTALPFASESLRAIVMTDVFHHIPNVEKFLLEANRCLLNGGRVIMIEPWVSHWSCWVYSNFHPEPFLPDTNEWEFPSKGSLSSANGALPWIVFSRDVELFEKKFQNLHILITQPFMPIRYLLSGGLTWPAISPKWSFEFWRYIESRLEPWMTKVAMFALIVLDHNK